MQASGAGEPIAPLVEPRAQLSEAELVRTARHRRLAGLETDGQRRIASARMAVIGAGGLGSPVVLALAAAGVGELVVFDDDVIELSNLQRQVIHRTSDVGALKADSAVRVAAELSETRVRAEHVRLTAEDAVQRLAGVDLVLDGTDSFESREIVAQACERLGVPLVWGTVQEFAGQVTVFWSAPPAGVPAVRLHDLYPPGSEAPACSAVGVFGPLCLQVGALMASEALKLVTGIGRPLLGRIALLDALAGTQREAPLRASRAADASATPIRRAAIGRPAVPEVDELPLASGTDARAGDADAAGTGADGANGAGAANGANATGGANAGDGAGAAGAAGAVDGVGIAIGAEGASATNGTDSAGVANGAGVAEPAAGILVLDVRNADEPGAGEIPGSVLVPLRSILRNVDGAVAELGLRDRDVVVVCEVGVRARVAAATLNAAGARASVLRGGMEGWARRRRDAQHAAGPTDARDEQRTERPGRQQARARHVEPRQVEPLEPQRAGQQRENA